MPTIKFINNEGRGFAGEKVIPSGQTIAQFLEANVSGNPNDYNIRVNKEPVVPSTVLQEGDTVQAVTNGRPDGVLREADAVSVTPKKIAGAWTELVLDFISDLRMALNG